MNRFSSHFSVLLLLLILLCSLCSCGSQLTAPEATEAAPSTQAMAENKVPETEEIAPDQEYHCANDSVLSTYKKRTQEDFDLACRHFEKEGYTLYSSLENSG